MSEQPCGVTGERCKSAGTYVSENGAKQFYQDGESFRPCPQTQRETRWHRVT